MNALSHRHNQRRDGDFTGVAQQRHIHNDSGIVAVHAPVELTERSWKRAACDSSQRTLSVPDEDLPARFWQNALARTDLAVAVDINT